MGMGRLNRPSLMVYGGSIKPGKSRLASKPLDVVSALKSYGEPHSKLEMFFVHSQNHDLGTGTRSSFIKLAFCT